MAGKYSVNDLHNVCLCAGATCGFEMLLESSIIAEDISLWEYRCLASPTYKNRQKIYFFVGLEDSFWNAFASKFQ